MPRTFKRKPTGRLPTRLPRADGHYYCAPCDAWHLPEAFDKHSQTGRPLSWCKNFINLKRIVERTERRAELKSFAAEKRR